MLNLVLLVSTLIHILTQGKILYACNTMYRKHTTHNRVLYAVDVVVNVNVACTCGYPPCSILGIVFPFFCFNVNYDITRLGKV